jgi:hypothetical protein
VDFLITIVLWVLIILLVLMLLNEAIIRFIGDAIVNMKADEHTPFTVDEITQDSISFSTTINVANEGKQCATIMDCYVRPLLPFEQFDGVKVEAKAELKGVPREDDYFESVLIQKKESIDIVIRVKLIDRKNNDIKKTLTNMVDLPLDIVYQHAARYPWKISKETVVLTAEEIADLAGIKLAD